MAPPGLLPCLLPYFLRHNNIEIRPLNNPTMASKCSSERKHCTFLTLNQRLEMGLPWWLRDKDCLPVQKMFDLMPCLIPGLGRSHIPWSN